MARSVRAVMESQVLPDKELLWFLGYLLEEKTSELLMREVFLNQRQEEQLNQWVERRKKGEPLQYIVGKAPFWKREFFVDSRVLIPRPETEILVELVLKEGDLLGDNITVLDMGTGSGNIAVSVQEERKKWKVLASDSCAGALEVARKNALDLAIVFREGDLLAPWTEDKKETPVDVVVANLPYVDPQASDLPDEVLLWEPAGALFSAVSEDVAVLADAAAGGGWTAHRLLEQCCCSLGIQKTILELSPTVAHSLEQKWGGHDRVKKIFRKKDLNGMARFLLIEWENG